MKKLGFYALIMSAFLVGCSSNEEEEVVKPTQQEELRIGDAVTADFGTSTMTISSTGTTSSAKAPKRAATQTETGYFFVRVDSEVPTSQQQEVIMGVSVEDYYPQNSTYDRKNHAYNYSSSFDVLEMQEQIATAACGTNKYVLDQYGKYIEENVLTNQPDMADIRVAFGDGKVTYHGIVVYDKKAGIDLLDDYKVIWYVAKQNAEDGKWHVDGALVPKGIDKAPVPEGDKKDAEEKDGDKTEESEKEIEKEKEEEKEQSNETDIEIDIDLDSDLVLEVDDFDIRKSGVDDYVAYEKPVDSNTLEYNGVVITRGSDMKLKISGLNNLEFDDENTVWTFEAYLWPKFDTTIPEGWEYGETDKVGTIDNALYNIEYHYYQGLQSVGTVPYAKVSVHVSKKK